jgi:hypothetical protein
MGCGVVFEGRWSRAGCCFRGEVAACPFCNACARGGSKMCCSVPSGVGAFPRAPFWPSCGLAIGGRGFWARCGDFRGSVGLRDAGVRPFARSFNCSSHSPRSML